MSMMPSFITQTDQGSAARDYVFVNGYVKAEFDNLGLEKEFERNLVSSHENGDNHLFMPENRSDVLKDKNWYCDKENCLSKQLSHPKNHYIARQMKWSLVNHYGDNIYLLEVNNLHLASLIKALEPQSSEPAFFMPVSILGYYQVEGNESLPRIKIQKIGRLTPSDLVQKIHKQHAGFNDKKLKLVITDILSLADNSGDTDQDRALNYALSHNLDLYMGAYELIYNHSDREVAQLNNVSVITDIAGERKIAKVVFDFQNVESSVGQHWYCAIDVTHEYPFLLTSFKRYLPRY